MKIVGRIGNGIAGPWSKGLSCEGSRSIRFATNHTMRGTIVHTTRDPTDEVRDRSVGESFAMASTKEARPAGERNGEARRAPPSSAPRRSGRRWYHPIVTTRARLLALV